MYAQCFEYILYVIFSRFQQRNITSQINDMYTNNLLAACEDRSATMSHEQRITLTQRHPNPLFEHWLAEWQRLAVEKDSMKRFALSKALESIRRYPLPLASGRECCILDGFGPTICAMLDKQLAVHIQSQICDEFTSQSSVAGPIRPESDLDSSRRAVLQMVGERIVEERQKRPKRTNEHQPQPVLTNDRNNQPSEDSSRQTSDLNVFNSAYTIAQMVPLPIVAAEVPLSPVTIVKKATFDIVLLVDTAETTG